MLFVKRTLIQRNDDAFDKLLAYVGLENHALKIKFVIGFVFGTKVDNGGLEFFSFF